MKIEIRTLTSVLAWGLVLAVTTDCRGELVLLHLGAGGRFIGEIIDEATAEDRIRLRIETGVELSFPLSSVVRRYSGEFLEHYARAETLARLRDWAAAADAYREAAVKSPDSQFAEELRKKARDQLLDGLSRLDRMEDCSEVEGLRSRIDAGDPETATRIRDAVGIWYRTHLSEWEVLGSQAELRDDYQAAILHYSKGAGCATDYPNLRQELAEGLARSHAKAAYRMYRAGRPYPEVIAHVTAAIDADPEFQHAHLLKADVICTRGQQLLDRREQMIRAGNVREAAALLDEASAAFSQAAEAVGNIYRLGGVPLGTRDHIHKRVLNLHNRLVARQEAVRRAPTAPEDLAPPSFLGRVRHYSSRGWRSFTETILAGEFWSRVLGWMRARWMTLFVGFPLAVVGGVFLERRFRTGTGLPDRWWGVFRAANAGYCALLLYAAWWLMTAGELVLFVAAAAVPSAAYLLYLRFLYQPKGVCPACGGGVLDYEDYEDLDFSHCPHCRAPLETHLSLLEYIRGVADSIERGPLGREGIRKWDAERPILQKDRMALFIRLLITYALRRRASDIHIELDRVIRGRRDLGLRSRLRMRVDGVLFYEMDFSEQIHAQLISAVKSLAEMDIADRLHPQDGHFQITADGADIQIRVSTGPTSTGEKMVLRLLDKRQVMRPPAELGFHPLALIEFENAIHAPQGVVLATGPSGSGKTTLLYSALHTLLDGEKSVVSIEDPIEYDISGINQIEHDPKTGMTFSNALRNILRQDPDIIMVGEMRDVETTKMAMEAAKTGHLVFSTLHTIDACMAPYRLVDLGVAPQDVAGVLRAVVAQRLVRTICPHCREETDPSPLEKEILGPSLGTDFKVMRGKGCEACRKTGYLGRTGLFEVLVVTEEIADLIAQQTPLSTVRRAAHAAGMKTLWDDGLFKVTQGITTVDEVVRVTKPHREASA